MLTVWKSKGFSNESIKSPAALNNSLRLLLELDYFDKPNILLEVNVSCLKAGRVSYILNTIINFYIAFEINPWQCYVQISLTLRNFLFGAVKLTENSDLDKYFYFGYGISFHVPGTIS